MTLEKLLEGKVMISFIFELAAVCEAYNKKLTQLDVPDDSWQLFFSLYASNSNLPNAYAYLNTPHGSVMINKSSLNEVKMTVIDK